MKKYKLIKTYPGSLELGTIVQAHNINNGRLVLGWNTPSFDPKKYSEYWQEVIEKDYEILSFKHKKTLKILYRDSQLKDVFCHKDGKSPFLDLEYCLISSYFEIHSVKRLSDGEVFTIGDKIEKHFDIKSFILIDDNHTRTSDGYIQWENGIHAIFSDPNEHCYLNILQKVKQPLFTTEDGVDIFDNIRLYYVSPAPLYNLNDNCKEWNINSVNQCISEGGKYFSTFKTALEYLFENKPCLSVNDIMNKLDEIESNYSIKTLMCHGVKDEFKKLVKSKLEE